MNNSNVIKLINENGVTKEYGQIPDLWHIAMAIAEGRGDYSEQPKQHCEDLCEKILEVWHMAHDLKAVIEKQGEAKIVKAVDMSQAWNYWNEETSYIESIDYDNPGKTFNHDTDCFYRYCLMQYKGAVKAQAWEAARRINRKLRYSSRR